MRRHASATRNDDARQSLLHVRSIPAKLVSPIEPDVVDRCRTKTMPDTHFLRDRPVRAAGRGLRADSHRAAHAPHCGPRDGNSPPPTKAGLTEPVSLHPVVDPSRCVGSATCVNACPENALGIIDGKAQLTNPVVCIGHGACAAACPVDGDHARVRHRTARHRHSAGEPEFRDQRPRNLHRRRAWRHGPHPQGRGAGKAGDRDDRRARRRRRRSTSSSSAPGPAGIAAGLDAIEPQASLPADRAGSAISAARSSTIRATRSR